MGQRMYGWVGLQYPAVPVPMSIPYGDIRVLRMNLMYPAAIREPAIAGIGGSITTTYAVS
jgi:hypothetical protein